MRKVLLAILSICWLGSGSAFADDRSPELIALHDAIDMEIALAQDARDALANDPENIVVIRYDESIYAVDTNEIQSSPEIAFAASVAHDLVTSNEDAAAFANDAIGNSVSDTISAYGFGETLSGIGGWVAERASNWKVVQDNLLTEERIRTALADYLVGEMRAQSYSLAEVDEHITNLWRVRDEVEAVQRVSTDDPAFCESYTFTALGRDFERPDAVALVGVRIPLFRIGSDYFVFGSAHLNPDTALVTGRYRFEGDAWRRYPCDGSAANAEHAMIERDSPPNPVSGVSYDGRSSERYDLVRATIHVFTDQ